MAKHPFDKQKQFEYVKTRNKYKWTCRKAEKKCRNELTKKLFELGLNNPKEFWNIIKKLNDWGKEKKDVTDQIKPDTWKEYFTKFLNDAGDQTNTEPPDETPDISIFERILDRIITMYELCKGFATFEKS